MTAEKLPRRVLIFAVFFGLCDLFTAGTFALLLPKYFREAVDSLSLPRVVAITKIVLIFLIFASAAGLLLRRRWGCTLYFIQFPLRLLTTILTLSFLLYIMHLFPALNDPNLADGIFFVILSFEWIRLFLTFGLRRQLIR